MSLPRKWRHRARVVEAVTLIATATAVRRLVPMPRWSQLLGESKAPADVFENPAQSSQLQFASAPLERAVALAVRSAGRRLPYDPRCLDRATAGQLMLRRRGCPGVVVIGLSPGEEVGETWGAHAWLVGDSGVLTGGAESRAFAAASCFVPPGRPPLELTARFGARAAKERRAR